MVAARATIARAKPLLPTSSSGVFVFLGKSGWGKTPLANALSMTSNASGWKTPLHHLGLPTISTAFEGSLA
eukprot:148786-Amphidinium_carterae.2